MKITTIGTGYVGLVSGLCFAKIDHDVICVDNNLEKITKLKSGEIPIYEPGLKEVLDDAVQKNKISFTTNLSQAIDESEAIFIAVGTPQDADGSADLSFVFAAAKQIAQSIKNDHKIIITKSTVPVGTGEKIQEIIKKENPDAKFSICSNPEFLREGCAIDDFLKPDRIIIGVDDEYGRQKMAEIYQYFDNKFPIVFSSVRTAEMTKYAANSFLATKIAFINEMSDLCEKTGVDVKALSHGIGLDSRIGNKFLNVGPGFGGSCFPKDILALSNISKKNKIDLSLIEAVIKSNRNRKFKMTDKIISAVNGKIDGKKIAILGLAFKGNTDDVRCSPSILIIKELLEKGAQIQAYDPKATDNTKKELEENSAISYFDNAYGAIKDADLLVIATEWPEFSQLELKKVKELQKSNIIVDLRNMLDKNKVEEFGFKYFYVGGN